MMHDFYLSDDIMPPPLAKILDRIEGINKQAKAQICNLASGIYRGRFLEEERQPFSLSADFYTSDYVRITNDLRQAMGLYFMFYPNVMDKVVLTSSEESALCLVKESAAPRRTFQ